MIGYFSSFHVDHWLIMWTEITMHQLALQIIRWEQIILFALFAVHVPENQLYQKLLAGQMTRLSFWSLQLYVNVLQCTAHLWIWTAKPSSTTQDIVTCCITNYHHPTPPPDLQVSNTAIASPQLSYVYMRQPKQALSSPWVLFSPNAVTHCSHTVTTSTTPCHISYTWSAQPS